MSEKIREHEVERDADGNIVERVYVERPRKKGGFGWGMLFGVVVIAGAILAFAYTQGSFQQAGVEADQASAQVQDQSATLADNTGNAIENAGDQVENATDRADTQTSDTATN